VRGEGGKELARDRSHTKDAGHRGACGSAEDAVGVQRERDDEGRRPAERREGKELLLYCPLALQAGAETSWAAGGRM